MDGEYGVCVNCVSDGHSCLGTEYCEGCESSLCQACWDEHNEDAACHVAS
jgi:hypothetical protein